MTTVCTFICCAAYLAVGSPKPPVEDDEGSHGLGIGVLEPFGEIFRRGTSNSALKGGGLLLAVFSTCLSGTLCHSYLLLRQGAVLGSTFKLGQLLRDVSLYKRSHVGPDPFWYCASARFRRAGYARPKKGHCPSLTSDVADSHVISDALRHAGI